ncbi:aldose epimerase family protein [Acidipila sp. EB88]|uniref:aldose epimerase family protein n=1 Tax=Acidipila sp. EB88 TaxID=2305226 RepID=UPI000F5F23D1|nr:aldose epimerase family protein [Acidipila sp. EB88]RRA47174.1 galactose mutarotase [Acidipila sp. EB88]
MKRLLGTAVLLIASTAAQASVHQESWGTASSGAPVTLYTLSDADLTVRITNYGARIVSIAAPDRHGNKADVVLGYKNLSDYEADKKTYFGAVVGRYGNRIAHGTFSLNGKQYHVPVNDGANALHGGSVGFDKKVWQAKPLADGVELTLVSPDGDMGFPGQLTAHVRYTLAGHALHIDYSATASAPTVLNLTNHSYFNLAGEGSGTILGQQIMIQAKSVTPVDAGLIPTGTLQAVAGTPFDFSKLTAIGARIDVANEQLKRAGGYDHNFVLSGGSSAQPHLAAKVVDPSSGRTLTVSTTQPGVQFYSGNFLAGATTGISGVKYQKHAGFCLETQHFPDSPNHPAFPTTTVLPGQTFHSSTIFTFGVDAGT